MAFPDLEQSVSDNQFKYNGKELQEDHELNWYDYGARFYDPALGRFNTQDRFAEKYHGLSPYHYTAGNPMKFIDVNGDSLRFADNQRFWFKARIITHLAVGFIFSGKARQNILFLLNDKETVHEITERRSEFVDGDPAFGSGSQSEPESIAKWRAGSPESVEQVIDHSTLEIKNQDEIDAYLERREKHRKNFPKVPFDGTGDNTTIYLDITPQYSKWIRNYGKKIGASMSPLLTTMHEIDHSYRTAQGKSIRNLSAEENMAISMTNIMRRDFNRFRIFRRKLKMRTIY